MHWRSSLLFTVALFGYSGAAQAMELVLTQPWYRVELIVFERLTEPNTREVLLSPSPRQFARNILAFDEDRSPYYAIDPDILELPSVFAPDPGYSPPWPDALDEADREVEREAIQLPPIDVPVPMGTSEASPAEALANAIAAFETELESTSLTWLPRNALLLNSEARRLGARGTFRVLMHGAFIQSVPSRESPIPLLIQTGDRYGERWSVEGSISVTLARFLHVHAQLWRAISPDLPDVQVLDEHRRMRSGELHYLDHPTFGVLIRIDPITAPQALIDQAAGVE